MKTQFLSLLPPAGRLAKVALALLSGPLLMYGVLAVVQILGAR